MGEFEFKYRAMALNGLPKLAECSIQGCWDKMDVCFCCDPEGTGS